MATEPKTLTPHHAPRRRHAGVFIVIVIMVALAAWILGMVLASQDSQTSTGLLSAPQTPAVTALPEALDSQQGKVLAAAVEESSKGSGEVLNVTVVPGESLQQRYMLRGGEVQPIFVFATQYPKFIGQTNIEDSVVILDMFGPTHLTGKIQPDANGNWSWEPSVPIKPGAYIFNIKATKASSSKVLAKDSLLFEVALAKGQKVDTVELNNIPQPGNQGTLFDVRAIISPQSKSIEAGSEVAAEIKFINFGSRVKPVDVEVKYKITDSINEIVSQTSETMAISDELIFQKTFFTSSSLRPGKYTLTVAVPSEDLIATATDTFELVVKSKEAGTAGVAGSNPFSRNNILLSVLGVLLLFGIIFAYIEYHKIVLLSQTIREFKKPRHI